MPEHRILMTLRSNRTQTTPQQEFEVAWNAHRDRVWHLVARLAGNRDLADDLTQEVSVRAFQAFGEFRRQSSPFTWLYRIATNVVLRYRERSARMPLSLEEFESLQVRASEHQGPEATAFRTARQTAVWAAINTLPEEYRVTLILHVYEELKYREIAEVLEIPLGTVKSRLNKAMQRLQEELNDYEM